MILLGDQALALIRDVFEKPALFDKAPRIQKRVVKWGANAPIEVEHSAVTVSEQTLLDAIRPSLPHGAREFDWTILAAQPLPKGMSEHNFGARLASALQVTLKDGVDRASCWIESLSDGWLFLVPGWLLAVGAPTETLLAKSRVIAPEITQIGASSGEFPAYARIASPLCAPGWLACGTAAMAFDPICGDGTAHAVREAILASAVIRALAKGGPTDDLLSHYETRLTAGFQRHLVLCRQFYSTGASSPLWRDELAAIDRGIDWCRGALASHANYRYQLRGFELEAVR